MTVSDVKEDFDSELNADWWREHLEEKERTRQLADAARRAARLKPSSETVVRRVRAERLSC